jgi:hypothetical protein
VLQGQAHVMEQAPGRLSRRSRVSLGAACPPSHTSNQQGAPEGPGSLPGASVLCPGAPDMRVLHPLLWGKPGWAPGAHGQLPPHPADLVREAPACGADKPTACAAWTCR